MEGLLFSLEVMAIGFTVVIVVLFALNLIFLGFGRVLTNDAAKREARKAEKLLKEKGETLSEKPLTQTIEKNTGPVKDLPGISEPGISPEILAVITAAVSAYMEKPEYRLRIKRITRGSYLAPWVLSGTEDIINTYGRDN